MDIATVTEIAEAEGIGRTLVSREANSPECRQLIVEFVSDERDEMCALFYRSLRAIESALSARHEYMTNEGEVLYGRAGSLRAPCGHKALPRFSGCRSTSAKATGKVGETKNHAAGARGTFEISRGVEQALSRTGRPGHSVTMGLIRRFGSV